MTGQQLAVLRRPFPGNPLSQLSFPTLPPEDLHCLDPVSSVHLFSRKVSLSLSFIGASHLHFPSLCPYEAFLIFTVADIRKV